MAVAAPSFTGMVQWWEEWQLRVLALTSLFLQLFLLVSATFRKYRVPALLRSCIWLAYLGGDALAIYALATVFNRHRQTASTDHGSVLEVMWVPVFLVHLGGQDSITAYNIEDNELWARHAVAMSSQAAVAVYVFWRSWSGGQVPESSPALLLFAAGFLKLGERLWALRRASFTRLAASQATGDHVPRPKDNYVFHVHPLIEPELQDVLMELFVDFPAPHPRRLAYLRSFLALEDDDAYEELCALLNQAFQFFYTKKEAAYTVVGIYLRTFTMLLGIAAIASFNDSRKDGFDGSDVVVSYVLLCSTLVLEICALLWLADWRFVTSRILPEMQRTVAQFNLIGFATRRRWPTMVVMRIAALFRCKKYVNQHWYLGHLSSTPIIIEFIRKDLKSRWVDDLTNAAAYRRFNDRRGQWTLRRERCYQELGWSVTELPFDEAVLVWHIATDIYLDCNNGIENPPATADERATVKCSREISNYMMYLLLFQPDMLMPGTRQSLFAVACHEIKHALRDQRQRLDERGVARWISENPNAAQPGDHLAAARRLAEAMMQMNDAGRMLKVISGVWVEMICYSASRCRGFLHAKSLGAGGEFLTVVWLLLHRMGMEVLADKLQKPEIPRHVQILP
ncbi:uncharacterized protein LOC127761903 [Oryza glaberrima]|uniref:uncharacterized protein LOC127761903 n=1 Tax=Oryza glaberrima TaxID=4538 RepID=UPI00224C3726|nr:uncharacterized protein LOC127761903 [Oryza glaberrima]